MSKAKRIAIVLTSIILSTSSLACHKTKKAVDIVVKEDDPWYESTRFVPDLDIARQQMCEDSDVQYVNGKICITRSIYDCLECYYQTKLLVYDEKGNQEKSVEISGKDVDSLQALYKLYPDSTGEYADALGLYFEGWFNPYFVKVDLNTGKITEKTSIVGPYGQQLNQGLPVNYAKAGEYDIVVMFENDSGTIGGDEVYIFKDKEYASVADLDSVGAIVEVRDIAYDEKSGNITMTLISEKNGRKYMAVVNPTTGELVECAEWDLDLIQKENLSDYSYTREGELLRVDSLGNIIKLDPASGETEVVLDNNWYSPYFSDYDMNKNSYGLKVLSRTDDTVVLCFAGLGNGFNDPTVNLTYTVTVLKKAEKNPHAGKKVIEINSPLDGTFSDYISEAIVNFNKTDDEYLIRVWAKHNQGYKPGYEYPSNYVDPNYSLIMELKSDDCPDLVMDVRKMAAMNDDILVDLSDYLEADTKSKLYENILSASQINGKSYLLPVTIKMEGLVVNSNLVNQGQVGFTFEQYEALVENKLDGVQPYEYLDSIYNNKDSFVLSSIDVLSMISSDPVNFDSAQFRQAAQYAKDHFYFTNYNEELNADEAMKEMPSPEARYAKIDTYSNYELICNTDKENYVIVGTPTIDGTGPRFTAAESISVAARSDRKEGCKKFLNYLYGASFMDSDAPLMRSICINKAVMEAQVPQIMELNRDSYEKALEQLFMESSLVMMGYKRGNEQMVDAFLDTLSSLSIYYLEEPDITNIINEELGSFYAGDHSIDDVVKYLNDRVSKYMTEIK